MDHVPQSMRRTGDSMGLQDDDYPKTVAMRFGIGSNRDRPIRREGGEKPGGRNTPVQSASLKPSAASENPCTSVIESRSLEVEEAEVQFDVMSWDNGDLGEESGADEPIPDWEDDDVGPAEVPEPEDSQKEEYHGEGIKLRWSDVTGLL